MFPKKCFVSLVVMFAVCAAAVNAQSEDGYLDYGEAEQELVVTAGRVSEETQKVPAQITVIDEDDIAQSGAASVVDVLETVAGVRFSGAISGAGSEVISMRGFGANSYGRVLVLVDGNKINDPDMKAANWNTIPLSGIERIEVLDGSASVLYGNNAVGGVINIITKKGGEKRTSIDLAGGSFFYNREALSHFQPMSWGNFSIAAEHSSSEGYRERQASQTTNVYGSSSVFINDTLQLSLNGFFSWLNFELPGGLTKQRFDDDPIQAINRDDGNSEYHFGGGLSFRWFPTENVELMLPLSYRGKSANIDMASFPSYTDRSVHSTEARPQASVTFDIAGMPLRILGGTDLYYTRLGADMYDDEGRTNKSDEFTVTEWTIGPYVTARFSPLPNLSFSVGGRFDTAVIKAETQAGAADGDKTFHAFVYDAGIVYNPVDPLKLYVRYENLFRYPFVDELAQVYSGSYGKFNSDLEPEKGFNTEIGASWQLEDFISISANFFFMRLEDEIAYNMGISANENLDETRRLGTNIGLSLTPVDLITFDGTYSFVNAVFTEGDNDGNRVPLVPQHKVYGSLMFNLPFGLSFGPDFEYTSDSYYDEDVANEADTMDSRFLLGARLRFALNRDAEQFSLQITAKNLLDKKYEAYGNIWDAHYPGDGRSINVSVNYRF